MVDIRTVPRSRTNPQYNFDVLGGELAPFSIAYERIANLGGLRSKSQSVPLEVNGYWENQSFHNYADYALSRQFEGGLDRLMAMSAGRRTAIMCAEAVWWRCHRRIVADYLLLRGRTVVHLEYDAYPEMAESEMARIAEDVKGRHEILHIAMAHRTGHVPIGEASVIIAVSAAHRGPAMDACHEAIDTLKQTVPVWKKEVFEGGEEWIGREGT